MHRSSIATARGRRRRFPVFPFLFVVAVGCCLALAACGGSSSNDPSSELPGKVAEQKMVKFAKCLREHGVNAETSKGPKGNGFALSIKSRAGEGKPGPGGVPPALRSAQRACQRYRPAPPLENLSPAEKAKEAQKALEFARCMRSHGVDVPDPGPSGVLELGNINPQGATFETAQKACQHLMGKSPLAIRAGRGPGPLGGNEGGNVASGPPAGGGEK